VVRRLEGMRKNQPFRQPRTVTLAAVIFYFVGKEQTVRVVQW
jgi:hypothetical protein